MSYWNYRVLEDSYGTLAIHEVYYDEKHNPVSCTADPIDIAGCESIFEIAKMMDMMRKALKMPILREDDF